MKFGTLARNYIAGQGRYVPDHGTKTKPHVKLKATPKTFKEWKAEGYHVMKGQKSTGRNTQGEATFSQKQVERNSPTPAYNFGRPKYPRRPYRSGDWQRSYKPFGHSSLLPYPIITIP